MGGGSTRRGFLAGCLSSLPMLRGGRLLLTRSDAQSEPAAASLPYVEPGLLAKLPFGTHSHYLQPWREEVSTVRAADCANGIGIVLDGTPTAAPHAALDLLARSGIANVRVELPWHILDYDDDHRLADGRPYAALLRMCRQRGMRPLILLNAHHGMPVPTRQVTRHLIRSSPAGARTVTLNSSDGIIIGRTGISDLSEFWAAEALILEVRDDQVVLSKPLPKPLEAGHPVTLATLKYAPFAGPGSASTWATLDGWGRYVDTIARFAGETLGTANGKDRGFDLEIWNELSFGARFLNIDNYYDPPRGRRQDDAIWSAIVAETATRVSGNPAAFSGVRVTNGFASTVPWPAASEQPAAITALSKHPYPRQLSFPRDEQKNTRCLGADGRPTSYIPVYDAFFPEYFATAIQTETILRDMGSETNEIYGKKHGRFARQIDGRVAPVPVWITEVGVNPKEVGVHGSAAIDRLKAKAAARLLLFYLNKGAERVYLYSAFGGDAEYGLVPDALLATERAPDLRNNASRDATSESLTVIGRISAVMRDGMDTGLRNIRPLQFGTLPSPGSGVQLRGDGTATNPLLRNADALALLPFQVNDRRFVIAHYAVTRDIRVDMAAEEITVDIIGLRRTGLGLALYDPLTDHWSGARAETIGDSAIRLALTVTDSPRLLVAQEAP